MKKNIENGIEIEKAVSINHDEQFKTDALSILNKYSKEHFE